MQQNFVPKHKYIRIKKTQTFFYCSIHSNCHANSKKIHTLSSDTPVVTQPIQPNP